MTPMTTRRRSDWLIPAGLILLSAVPAIAGTARLGDITAGVASTEATARFLATPAPIVLHLVAVIPFSIVGAFQFTPAIRRAHRGWHRGAGAVLLALGLIAALTGLWMAHFYPWPDGDGWALYGFRLVFGSAMVASIVLSVNAIRRRDFVAHGRWMIRAYAIGMGAGTEVVTHLPYFVFVGTPDEATRAALMGAGWIINVAAAEWIIRRAA